MKKILFILTLFITYATAKAQVKVLDRIVPNSIVDTYPTHVDSLGRGGLMAVGSWQERNAIPMPRRKSGMLVRVKSSTVDSTYTIGGDLSNYDWYPFFTGGSSALWGEITGSLSSQTDLKSALDSKANMSSVVSNVGQPKGVPFFNNSGLFSVDSTKLKYNNSTGSLYVKVNSIPSNTAGTITFFGNSITAGVGTSSTANRYTSLVCATLGATEVNMGVSSSTLQKRSPIDYGGAVNMVDRVATIPSYVAGSTRFLIFSYGINDFRYDGGGYSSTNFLTDYTTVVNYAISTRGWPADRIVVTSLPYIIPAYYSNVTVAGSPNQTTMDAYNAAVVTLKNNTGVRYADIYNYMRLHGASNSFYTDKLHSNDLGHKNIATAILDALKDPVTLRGQSVAANGLAEFSELKINTYTTLSESDKTSILGIDSAKNVGIIGAIPSNTRYNGDQYINGRLVQGGITTSPSGFGSKDWLFRQSSRLVGIFDTNTAYQGSIELSNGSAGMDFKLTYNQGKYRFFTNTSSLAMQINGNMDVDFGKSITVPYGANGLTASAAGGTGSFEPFSSVNTGTNIRNSWQSGVISTFVSGGTNGNQVEATRINRDGRYIHQFGGTFTDVPSALAQWNSTTMGVLFPRMTTSQFSAISSKATGLFAFDITTNRPTVYDGASTKQIAYTEDVMIKENTSNKGDFSVVNSTTYPNTQAVLALVTVKTVNRPATGSDVAMGNCGMYSKAFVSIDEEGDAKLLLPNSPRVDQVVDVSISQNSAFKYWEFARIYDSTGATLISSASWDNVTTNGIPFLGTVTLKWSGSSWVKQN